MEIQFEVVLDRRTYRGFLIHQRFQVEPCYVDSNVNHLIGLEEPSRHVPLGTTLSCSGLWWIQNQSHERWAGGIRH